MSDPQFYEYTNEQILFGGFFTSQPKGDYMRAIRTHAAKGWRLHQMLILPNSEGGPNALELIFERPARGPQDVLRADADEPAPLPSETAPEFKQPSAERPPWTPWSGPIP